MTTRTTSSGSSVVLRIVALQPRWTKEGYCEDHSDGSISAGNAWRTNRKPSVLH